MNVLRIQETCKKIALSRTTLWRLCQQTDFPKPIRLGGRAIGFLEHEVDHWLESQADARFTSVRGS
jgi:prophage regulatory protein